MDDVTVIKLAHDGREKWRWTGRLLQRGQEAGTGATFACVEAFFNVDEHDNGLVTLRRGDRYVEWYYGDRLYNVFDIYERETGERKAWYCDLCRPATFEDGADGLTIRFEDLELDLMILPDRTIHVLDEDDFAAAPLGDEERAEVLAAVAEIRALVAAGEPPFGREVADL